MSKMRGEAERGKKRCISMQGLCVHICATCRAEGSHAGTGACENNTSSAQAVPEAKAQQIRLQLWQGKISRG